LIELETLSIVNMTHDLVLVTYNCGKHGLTSDYVSKDLISPLLPKKSPKFIVVGLQEIAPTMKGCFDDVDSYLDPVIEGIESAIKKYPGSFTRIVRRTYGATALIIYIAGNDAVEVTTSSTGCGYFRSSLKGAVGAHIKAFGQQFTFVCAHLTANQGMVAHRNRDFLNIVKTIDFGNGKGAYQPDSHFFFLGDLNYRCTKDPTKEEGEEEDVFEFADEGEQLLSRAARIAQYGKVDELSLAMEQGDAFFGFTEPQITFAPTFKFYEGAPYYSRRRIPSWCDRVLYLNYNEAQPVISDYSSLSECRVSDHRPVFLALSVPDTPPKFSDQDLLADKGISLALSAAVSRANLQGYLADRTVGWALYLSTTRQGGSFLAGTATLVALIAIYAYLFL
jgi:hypothetical protein